MTILEAEVETPDEESADLVSFLLRDENWMELAACKPDPRWTIEQRQAHTSKFFPERGQSQAPGKAICARCPVGAECARYATKTDTEYGMWEGTLRSRGNYKNPQPEAKDEPMIPRTLSASSILTYLGCPARWKAENLEGARTAGGSAASLGTSCHTAFEVWVKDGHYLVPRTLKDQELVMKGIYDEAYWREFADGDRFEEGWGLVKKWLARQDWNGREVISTESKEYFDIPTTAGPIRFNYIMDRLDKVTDFMASLGDDFDPNVYGVEVVDYKSLIKPLQPSELKSKPQARIYALATQLKYPHLEKIWVTFDMLRYDPVGVVFTKEENRATWTWLCMIAQRIVDDEEAVENLNDDCRYCIRKSVCKTLVKHSEAGGPLGFTDPAAAAKRHFEITRAAAALKVQADELEKYLLAHMQHEDIVEDTLGDYPVKVTISSRRGIDDDRVRAIVGDTVMASYGSMTIGKLDRLLAGADIDAEQKLKVKSLITRNYGEPAIKVEAAPVFP